MVEFSIQELRFAQKYPFTPIAKRIVQESGFTLNNVPDSILNRARSMVSAAFLQKEYMPKIETSSDLLKNEILAFPVSKIIVTLINRFELYRKYSQMFGNSVFKNLEGEKDDVVLDMATDLNLKFDLSDDSSYFVELGLADYLRPELEENFMKLVNRGVENGKVMLTRNDFVRFISIVVSKELRNSLPVKIKEVPSSFKETAEETDIEFAKTIRQRYSKTDFGEVAPESFPPCMAKIYSELMSGINVTHSGRFVIATFLNSIGMPSEKIIDMYRETPNFNERTTRYQVERLSGVKGKSYSAPSCDKMRSYNLCISNCPVTHPVQFYSREISKGKNNEANSEDKVEQKNVN